MKYQHKKKLSERATLFVVVQHATIITIPLDDGSLQLHTVIPLRVVPSFDNHLGKLGWWWIQCLL